MAFAESLVSPFHGMVITAQMTARIALFNHKGGVSKTTTTFNLGWMLASKGWRVILVDTDPQCNLTGMVLGHRGQTELQRLYQEEPARNIMAGLAPAFESRPSPIEPVDCLPIPGPGSLFLLPGHLRLAEYEVTLGIAQELSGSIQALQNLPGSISYLLDVTAEKFKADIVLIDMSPSLGPLNQNIFATSDFFIVPTSPDFFSVMAIDSLSTVLPRWQRWARNAASLEVLKRASYRFPEPHTKFLGVIVQRYRPRAGQPAQAFQKWIDEIDEKVEEELAAVLKNEGMLLPANAYSSNGVSDNYRLATIPDFNSLIAKSQKAQTPIFSLTAEQIGQVGRVLEVTLASQKQFRDTFDDLAVKVLGLTQNAARHRSVSK